MYTPTKHNFVKDIDLGAGVHAGYKSQSWDGERFVAIYVIDKSPFSWQIGDELYIDGPQYVPAE